MKNITCFGEILWDVFPNGEKIGGAPLNVAARLQSFNNNVSVISSVGNDKRGKATLEYLNSHGLNTNCLQIKENLETGVANVTLDQKGSASYEFSFPRAWDEIELTEESKNQVLNSNAFVYGTLVTRNATSRDTLYKLLELAKFKVYDVNLRPPYYSIDVIQHLMNAADFVKFNDDELFEIVKEMGSELASLEQNISFISEKTNTSCICVTKGRHGAVLYLNGQFYYNGGYRVKVVDTVGAGDSFLATLIGKLITQDSPQECLNYACAVGAIVAGSEGANPEINQEKIESFLTV